MLTIVIIAVTALISYLAFNNSSYSDRLIFDPREVKQGGWYRLISYGVLHADLTHLIFNMLTLYIFGTYIEKFFKAVFGNQEGGLWYIALYISALIISILPTYLKEKNNEYYRGLGASGAVSAVVFAYILINPMSFMGIMFIPVMLPAFLFGILFVILSIFLQKKHSGGINHTAHITGGIYGVIFTAALFRLLTDISILRHFAAQIQISSISDLIHIGF